MEKLRKLSQNYHHSIFLNKSSAFPNYKEIQELSHLIFSSLRLLNPSYIQMQDESDKMKNKN